MKRPASIFALALLFVLLPCCSVQESMNTEIFVERVMKATKTKAEAPGVFFDGSSGCCFLTDEGGKRIMLRTQTADGTLERIKGFDVSAEYDEGRNGGQRVFFIEMCESCTGIFAAEEKNDPGEITENLFYGGDEEDICSFYETEHYRYSFIKNKAGAFFHCESKRMNPDRKDQLTRAVH